MESIIAVTVSSVGFDENPKLSQTALCAFFRISKDWRLDREDESVLLGQPGEAVLADWRREPDNASLPRDTLERISYLLGIHKALLALFPDAGHANAWVRRPNAAPLFGGGSALERMLAGNVCDLYVVRKYLDLISGPGA